MPAQDRAFSADDPDEALMLAYAAGSAAAFDALYARHKGPVYRYFLRQCGHAGIAEELFQDVWMNAIRARASYVPAAKFTTWLYTLARHRLVDHWRAQGHIGFVSLDAENDESKSYVETIPGSRVDEPATRAESREIGRRIAEALASLPAVQREAFLLQQEAELSLEQIAEVTGTGKETVKSRLRYATAKLRTVLEPLR